MNRDLEEIGDEVVFRGIKKNADTITDKLSQTPGKMFDIDLYSKFFRTSFNGDLNTTIAIKSEMR